MSGVLITGDGDRLRCGYRFLCPDRTIKSTFGLEELIIYIYDIYKDHLQISNTDKVSFQDVLAGD